MSLNFSTNTILLEIQFRSKLILTVKSVQNTNSVPVSCILHKTLVEWPVKQLLHPSWLAKFRPENLHLMLLLGPQDLWCAEMCTWEPEVCLHLILPDPEQRILCFFVESTFTAHRSAQPSVTDCFSAVCSSNRFKKGTNMNYNTTHTTTKQTESRGKIKPRKIGKEKIVRFLAIGRDKALEEKNHLFHFTLLFVTYEKKKKTGRFLLQLFQLQAKTVRPHCKLNKELGGL